MADTAVREFLHNLRLLPQTFKEAWLRLGKVPESEREESQATFHNFFLHIHSVRVHLRTLSPTLTWGLGLAATASFVILTITGVLLMVYYKPSTELAYQSMKDIHFTVATGRFIRNIHRWSAHVMVVAVFLHMARVFFTASYKKPREFNWLIGLALLVTTLGLSFTGYLLPWDQLAYWGVTVGTNMARATPLLGHEGPFGPELGMTPFNDVRFALLGGSIVDSNALLRAYIWHCIGIPILASTFMVVHFWRVRKDGGISGPSPVTLAKEIKWERLDER